MKKIIIILVVLLLLGGGGGAAYYFLLMPPPEGEEVVEEAPLQNALETATLQALSIPVIRQGRVAKYVMIKISLELTPKMSEERILLAEPRIRDSCLRELHAYFAGIPIDAPINIRTVKKRLLRAVHSVVGKSAVSDVFIQGIYEKTS